jgi:hypothetical protein
MAAGAIPSTSVVATSVFIAIDTIDSFSGVQIEATVEAGL